MDVPQNRMWMYNRVGPKRVGITDDFMNGVETFISHSSQLRVFFREGTIRCPCVKCNCRKLLEPDEVRLHLYQKGFQPDYYYWTSHGEKMPQIGESSSTFDLDLVDQPFNPRDNEVQESQYEEMVLDAARHKMGVNIDQMVEEPPNPDAQAFYDMLKSAQAPLWEGCNSLSELSAAVRLLSIKSDYNMAEGNFNAFMQFMGEAMPSGHRLPENLYQTKKLVAGLGLGYMKIDCCENGCMLYYKDNVDETECKFCGSARYTTRGTHNGTRGRVGKKQLWFLPLIPRLQRLFTSEVTAKEMRWHHENRREAGVLSHPSDGLAWKMFNQEHPGFAADPRNVRLGLCADGFTPFGQSGKVYSCWPVIITPYNLPPGRCMRQEVMFLTLIIPGPSNPKAKIDVYLQPLIDELKLLWAEGVMTYDASLKQNFNLRAALMWTINDFPAYGMLSGWMTAGKLSCPICMEASHAFTLKNGRKTSFFDCHRRFLPLDHPYRRNKNAFLKNKEERSSPPMRLDGTQVWRRICNIPMVHECGQAVTISGYGVIHNWTKRSIFWELPYWKTNLVRHNLDVMHIEKNVFDNIFNIVMDDKGRTKDNVKARMDIKEYCRRKDLELVERSGKQFKPKARYSFNLEQKRVVCEWVKNLRLPDGYASNLVRCVDSRQSRLHGMKSHDCHIFLERFLPIAFIDLPDVVWRPLTELSQFFREICSTTLTMEKLTQLEENIPVTLCKLEKIFPPGFFDSMEHLPVHLAYEAKVGGPVQYRWMYPFERFLYTLKRKVKNKARVEGSICEAYITEETATFCSHYFEPTVVSRLTRVPRNDDGGEPFERFSIFNYPGRPSGDCGHRFLTDQEVEVAIKYILMNCDEVQPYLE